MAHVLPPYGIVSAPIERGLRPCLVCGTKGRFDLRLANWGAIETMGLYCENGHGKHLSLPPISIAIADISERYRILMESAKVLAEWWENTPYDGEKNEK